ncbi:MAG: hypothetical protein V1715_13425 [bacterium]
MAINLENQYEEEAVFTRSSNAMPVNGVPCHIHQCWDGLRLG